MKKITTKYSKTLTVLTYLYLNDLFNLGGKVLLITVNTVMMQKYIKKSIQTHDSATPLFLKQPSQRMQVVLTCKRRES